MSRDYRRAPRDDESARSFLQPDDPFRLIGVGATGARVDILERTRLPASSLTTNVNKPGMTARLAPKYESEYAYDMQRVTATLDEETLAKIRRVAGPRGVSSFLNLAASERLARLELRGLLDDLDVKHGAVSAAVRAEIAADARRIFRTR